jgi:hypothetical protein
MPNFNLIWPSGLTNGVDTLDETELERLDLEHTKAPNFTDGSTHAPTAKVAVGGAGIGGNLPANENWQYGADSGSKRTFTRTYPPTPVTRLEAGGSITARGFLLGGASGNLGSFMIPIPDNCVITKVRAYVRIATGHGSVPTLGPGLSLQSIPTATAVLTDTLHSADPIRMSVPGTVVAYEAGGAVQFWDYTPNQNATFDRSVRWLVATLTDESGGGAQAGNIFTGVDVTYTQTEARP